MLLRNCKLRGSSDDKQSGLGFTIESSHVKITNCSLWRLKSFAGSAVRVINVNTLTASVIEIYDSYFAMNRASVGAAILFVGRIKAVLENNLFEDNKAFNISNSLKSGIGGCIYASCENCS